MKKSARHTAPPQAAKKPQKFTIHGDTRTDNYAWLQNPKDPAVLSYIKSENDYADAWVARSKRQAGLYKEIRARVTEDDMSVPVKDGPYLYYTKTLKGKQYAIHCRAPFLKNEHRTNKLLGEEVILDENKLAKGATFFALGDNDMSPNHRLLAYTTDTTGNEKFTLAILDLDTGKHLADSIESVSSVVWDETGEYLFYTKEQHPYPPSQVFRHKIGADPATDDLIFEETDKQWSVSIEKSRSLKYLFISVGNFDSTEMWYMPSGLPLEMPRLIAPRRKKIKYGVEHHGEHFYIVTNEKAVNYKIMFTRTDTPEQKHWKPWMPYVQSRAITGFMAFKDFFAITAREGGSEWLFISPTDRPALKKLPMPEKEHAMGAWSDLEFDSAFVRFSYSSFITPKTVFDYAVSSKTLSVRKRQRVPGWNAAGYVSERIWVTNDGVKVPISLCYSKKVKRNGTAPCLMLAYGSYGITYDPVFSIAHLSLLKRGWIIAIAHPRGGGEMGWDWHEVAKLRTKHRTYHDVIACADALVQKKYCARHKLVLSGGSAGGMMAGAVLNMRPDLVGAAMVYVPNSDVLTSMLDTSLGGTIMHYDELGNPHDKKVYDYFKKWSPYQNVRSAKYPALLIRSSMHDIRTPYWEAAKWAAALREKSQSDAPLLLKIETNGGHAGKSGRYEWIKEKAWDYAFLLGLVR